MKLGLTRPLPAIALPVVEELRRIVPRPRDLPDFDAAHHDGRPFPDSILCWRNDGGEPCCPMGLHPQAGKAKPCHEDDFMVLDLEIEAAERAVVAFREWWDEQRDEAAAVAAVWGPR